MNLFDDLLSMTPSQIYDKAASGLNTNITDVVNKAYTSVSNTTLSDIMSVVGKPATVPQTVIISNPVEVKNPATQTVEQKNSQTNKSSKDYSSLIVPVLAGAVILFFVWRG